MLTKKSSGSDVQQSGQTTATSNDQPASSVTSSSDKNAELTESTVAQHNKPSDCWTIIHGKVYNLTDYVNQHPGGDVITKACGTDGTTAFDTQDGEGAHSAAAQSDLNKLLLGSLQN